MKFQIRFKSIDYGNIVDYERQLGWDDVITAREESDVANLPSNLIQANHTNGKLVNSGSYIDVAPSDVDVAEIPHFSNTSDVVVNVADDFLTDYTEESIVVNKCRETGTIQSVVFEASVNKLQILADWIEEGCPLKWGFEGKDDSE